MPAPVAGEALAAARCAAVGTCAVDRRPAAAVLRLIEPASPTSLQEEARTDSDRLLVSLR